MSPSRYSMYSCCFTIGKYFADGPLTRYVKLQVAHAPGMPGTFSRHWLQRKPLISDPGMHHRTCATYVLWCKTFPVFPAHAQLTILRIWQEAHDAIKYALVSDGDIYSAIFGSYGPPILTHRLKGKLCCVSIYDFKPNALQFFVCVAIIVVYWCDILIMCFRDGVKALGKS